MAADDTNPRLTWQGKSDPDVEPAALRQTGLVPSDRSGTEPANRLIQGENASVMAGLLSDLRGQFDLIYVDPPFLTGNRYRARIGRGEDSRQPAHWETTSGYRDRWQDTGQYLDMLFARLRLMYELLSARGTLYLHLDWHANAYGRLILDEIFGPDRLLNEIIWVYHGPSPIKSAFNRKHDTILAYAKSDEYIFNVDDIRVPYSSSTVKTFESSTKAGFGKVPDLERGKVPEDWWYFPVVARLHSERTGYPTQKPEALLERIVLASSERGSLVGDFFSGAGTLPVVASRHGRKWIACDDNQLAFWTTYRRLLLEDSTPGFTTWLQKGQAEPSLAPDFRIESSGLPAEGPRSIHLTGLRNSRAPGLFPDMVVLWEIGSQRADDQVFVSHGQRARPWRADHMETALDRVPEDIKNMRVRAVDSLGDWGLTG